jgi:hypothetical protein
MGIPGKIGRASSALALAAGLLAARPLAAQTDYYNTDRGRPVRIEDAAPVEREAFEVQLAPLRLERAADASYRWSVEPELAYGFFRRTQVEVGLPLHLEDAPGADPVVGLGGIHLSALHALNVETRSLPALAVAATLALPVGGLAPYRAFTTVKGIATRTLPFVRLHANAEYTLGSTPAAGAEVGEASRWMAGVAADRAFPLRSLLATADLFAEQPLHSGADLAWTGEAGVRYQTSPQFNLDLGVGRRFSGDDRRWFLTFGLSHAFALRALAPGR